jgi:hypothetical protein
MITRIIAAVMFIAAAVVMFVAANLPEQPRIAPKTKIAVPCPECPVTFRVTFMEGENGQVMVLKAEPVLPKPMLMASPAARPMPIPGMTPPPATVAAQRKEEVAPCPPFCELLAQPGRHPGKPVPKPAQPAPRPGLSPAA